MMTLRAAPTELAAAPPVNARQGPALHPATAVQAAPAVRWVLADQCELAERV